MGEDGMMSGMDDTAAWRPDDADEEDLSLEALTAAFEAGTPVDLARSARKIVIEYAYEDHAWRATSPDLTGFAVEGPSLHEARRIVKADLASYLDPAVTLEERVPEAGMSVSTSRDRVMNAPISVVLRSANWTKSGTLGRVVISKRRQVSA